MAITFCKNCRCVLQGQTDEYRSICTISDHLNKIVTTTRVTCAVCGRTQITSIKTEFVNDLSKFRTPQNAQKTQKA